MHFESCLDCIKQQVNNLRGMPAGMMAARYACGQGQAAGTTDAFAISKAFSNAVAQAVYDAEIACTFPGSSDPSCKLSDEQVRAVAEAQVSGFSKSFGMSQQMCGCAVDVNATIQAMTGPVGNQTVMLHSEDCETRALYSLAC